MDDAVFPINIPMILTQIKIFKYVLSLDVAFATKNSQTSVKNVMIQ